MCRFIWKWIHAKQIAPRDTRGHLGGFKGPNIQRSVNGVKRTAALICTNLIWFTSADSSGNGHRLNTSRPPIPQGACREGWLGGHKFKSLGKLSIGWTDWHHIWYTSVDSSGNGLRLKQFAPQYLRAMACRFHIYSLNCRYLQLKCTYLQFNCRYLQFNWRYLQFNWRYLQIG